MGKTLVFFVVISFCAFWAFACTRPYASDEPDLNEGKSQDTMDASISQRACQSLLDGPRRGVSCLHCMHPQAEEQALDLAEVMIGSCLKRLAVNYIVDDSFGYNESLLLTILDTLNSGGRNLTLIMYLGNGPAQRQWRAGSFAGLGNSFSPEDFRERIRYDPKFQAEYQNVVRRLLPVLTYAQEKQTRVVLAPMLEDNLDSGSFRVMVDLIRGVVGPMQNVAIARSPCVSCYDGNDSSAVGADLVETHNSLSSTIRITDGIVTNDGFDYEGFVPNYGCASGGGSYTLPMVVDLELAAGKTNNTFLLWTGRYQGLGGVKCGAPLPEVDSRIYPRPSDADRGKLIDILRAGL